MRSAQIIILILVLGLVGLLSSSAQADTPPSAQGLSCTLPELGTESCAKQISAIRDITHELFGKKKVVDPLTADAKAAVRKLSRPVEVFHWADSRNLGIAKDEKVKPNDRRVKKYLEKEASNFWDLSHFDMTGKVGEIGNGLYTANDPGMSSTFGGDSKAVVSITMPKKTKFLDIRYAITPLSSASLQELKKAGCAAKDLPSVFTDNNPACFKFVPPLLKALGVSAVAQNWGWDKLMDCGSKPGVAFMIVNSGLADKRHAYRVFDDKSKPGGDDAKDMKNIEEGVLEWSLPDDTMYANKKKFPDASAVKLRWGPVTQFNDRVKYLDWMKSHLYSCGSYPEDTPDPKAPVIAPVTPADREAADLMDRYTNDLTHFNVNPLRIHTVSSAQISKDDLLPSSVVKPANDSGKVYNFILQTFSPKTKMRDSAELESFLNTLNWKISQFRDKKNWANSGGDSTNLVQLGVSAAQDFLKVSPFASGNDRAARELMVYIWKSFNQPAVLTPDLLGDLKGLNVADYSSAGGKDLWLNPYREGVARIESCIKKYDKKPVKAAKDKVCGLDA